MKTIFTAVLLLGGCATLAEAHTIVNRYVRQDLWACYVWDTGSTDCISPEQNADVKAKLSAGQACDFVNGPGTPVKCGKDLQAEREAIRKLQAEQDDAAAELRDINGTIDPAIRVQKCYARVQKGRTIEYRGRWGREACDLAFEDVRLEQARQQEQALLLLGILGNRPPAPNAAQTWGEMLREGFRGGTRCITRPAQSWEATYPNIGGQVITECR